MPHHPGGDFLLRCLGGHDATAQYYSYHYHNRNGKPGQVPKVCVCAARAQARGSRTALCGGGEAPGRRDTALAGRGGRPLSLGVGED